MDQTTGFSVFLLKRQFNDFRSALKSTAGDFYDIRSDTGINGIIFVGEQHSVPPLWLPFLNEGAAKPIGKLFNSSNRSVLFVRTKSAAFAWVFGFGRHLLKEESYVKDFGLKVTLNSVDPEKLRSVDKAEIQEIVKQTRTQLSQAGSIGSFGVDPAQDLMRAVAGQSLAFPFTKVLSGEEALHFSAKMDFQAVGSVGDSLLKAYRSTKYRANFEWVDNMQPVREKTVEDQLDGLLLAALSSGTTGKAHLAPPELFNWDDHDVFAFSNAKNDEVEELTLDAYLSAVRNVATLSVQKLKQDHILARNTKTSEFSSQWSLYRALVYETTWHKKYYILALGRWFCIEPSFVKRVKDYVRTIPNFQEPMPPCRRREAEGAYNRRIQKASSSKFILLDKVLIKPDFANSFVEPCDILSRSGDFIHIKKRHFSSTLSHLFSQGKVSAEALLRDPTFLTALNKRIKRETNDTAFLVPNDFSARDYTIVYAIVSHRPEPLHEDLPFFSLVNMMQSVAQLRLFGFKVAKAKISIA